MPAMQKYVRVGRVELAPTLELLAQAFEQRQSRSRIGGFEVNTKSMRLKTFTYKGTTCACCGLQASFFALERGTATAEGSRPHLNLWGVNEEGEEVLFTQDHIKPLAKRGQDTLANSQTMCGPCNWAKKDTYPSQLPAEPQR